MSYDPFPTAPPQVRWGAALAIIVVELAIILYLVVAAVSYGSTMARDALPYALAAVGLHQAVSPTAAVLPPKTAV